MKIISNFESSMTKYLDSRQSWESLATLQANTNTLMPDGFRAYCRYEALWYKLSTSDPSNPLTYNWTRADVDTETLQELMQYTVMPNASADYVGKIFQYIGASNEYYVRGRFYNVTEDGGIYSWTEVVVQPEGQTIQYTTLPEANTMPLGTIVQYVGTTTGTRTTGFFYENEVINYSITFPEAYTPAVEIVDRYKLERCGLGVNTTVQYDIEVGSETGVWKIGDNEIDLATYGLAMIDGATTPDGYYFTIVYNAESNVINWLNQPVQPAGSGGGGGGAGVSAIFNEAFTPTVLVPGTGIDPNHTWTSGSTLEKFLRDAFCPPIEPSYTISLTPAEGLKPAGTPITNPVVNVNLTDFKSAIPSYCSLTVTRYNGTETTGGVVIGQQAATALGPYSFTDSSVISTTVRYDATLAYCFTEGEMLSKTIGTYYTMTNPSYSGSTTVLPDNLTAADVTGLSNSFLNDNAGFIADNVSFSNERFCYAFPSSEGVVVRIVDINGFDVTSAFETTPVTINSVSYTAWIMTDTASLTNGYLRFYA